MVQSQRIDADGDTTAPPRRVLIIYMDDIVDAGDDAGFGTEAIGGIEDEEWLLSTSWADVNGCPPWRPQTLLTRSNTVYYH